MNEKYEIVKFIDGEFELDVNISPKEETVWLSLDDIAILFDRDKSVISRHIKNIFTDKELNSISVVAKNATTASDGKSYMVTYYNLDMIISIGFRVKSQRGIVFRKWAMAILKKYLIEGYVANEKRLRYLEKQISLISIASRLDDKIITDEGNKILKAIIDYNKALRLLDDCDHQCLTKPEGTKGCYVITYDECRVIIDSMKFDSKIFGVERDGSFHSSINAIYQTALGEDIYTTNEEKAANLLYFIVKNHSFIDGNKRIAASIFLYFLDRNNMLYVDGIKRLSDTALVATTILIAESNPIEKDIIIDLVMNFLTM